MPTIATLDGIMKAILRIGSIPLFNGHKTMRKRIPGRKKIKGIPAKIRMKGIDEDIKIIGGKIISGMTTRNVIILLLFRDFRRHILYGSLTEIIQKLRSS